MTVQNISLASNGAKIILASSCDDRHHPQNIIDGNPETFWSTTGMYPQSFFLQFPAAVAITGIAIQCYNIKFLKIECTKENEPTKFTELVTTEMEETGDTMQTQSIQQEVGYATHLRFEIMSGHDHFCSVHRVAVTGMII